MPPETTSGGFWTAITGLIILVTTILQTVWHEYKQKRIAAGLANTTKDEAAKLARKTEVTSDKVDSVYQVLNGKGLSGKLDEIASWQEQHEKNDVKRFAEMHAFLQQFSPPEKRTKAADPTKGDA